VGWDRTQVSCGGPSCGWSGGALGPSDTGPLRLGRGGGLPPGSGVPLCQDQGSSQSRGATEIRAQPGIRELYRGWGLSPNKVQRDGVSVLGPKSHVGVVAASIPGEAGRGRTVHTARAGGSWAAGRTRWGRGLRAGRAGSPRLSH
jgi:hypothetical protein